MGLNEKYVKDTKVAYKRDSLPNVYEMVAGQAENRLGARITDVDAFKTDTEKAMQVIKNSRCGMIDAVYHAKKANGKERKIRIHLYWYALHCLVYFDDVCYFISEANEEPCPRFSVSGNYRDIMRYMFPERCERLNFLVNKRKIERAGIIVPDKIESLYFKDIQCSMALVQTKRNMYYLCSPLSCVPIMHYENNVFEALWEIGINIPKHTEDIRWSDIEPYWILQELAR